VSRYEKGKTNLDFTEARDSEWHQLGHMQVCILLQTDNHASTPTTQFFYRLDALPATQPRVSALGLNNIVKIDQLPQPRYTHTWTDWSKTMPLVAHTTIGRGITTEAKIDLLRMNNGMHG